MTTLDSIEINPAREADAAVIWLHGLGADAHDFEPIVPELGLPADMAVRFVFPNAPVRPVTINGGMRMRAWYDILDMDLPRRVDEAGVRDSATGVEALIRREQERGIDSRRIVLAGFSQGGAMALHSGLRYPDKLAGVMGLSCYLLMPDKLPTEASTVNRDTPIFLAHGSFDEVVPVHYGQSGAKTLTDMGYPVQWREYPMPHAVHPQEIRDIGAWLREVLGKQA